MKNAVNNDRIMVVGAGGSLGQQMCAEVARQCGSASLILGDYKVDRAEALASNFPGAECRYINLDIEASIGAAIDSDVTAVIVCAVQDTPYVQMACIERHVPCLDVTIQPEFVGKVIGLESSAQEAGVSLVTMAGLWPGLSGLMAKHAVSQLDDTASLDLALCQNTQANAGPRGIADMLGAFSQQVSFYREGEARRVPGFRVKRRITYPAPFGSRNHRLVDFVEGPILSEALGVTNINLWTGFNSATFDTFIAALGRLGLLKLFNMPDGGLTMARVINRTKGFGPDRPEPTAIVVEAHGTKSGQPRNVRVALTGPSDYGLTSMCAVAMARQVAISSPNYFGAGHPVQFFDLLDIVEIIDHSDLTLTCSIS